VSIAVNEQRIVLTRDRRLLYVKHISHGYWVRAVDVESQVDEVLRRFNLYGSIHPFARCLVCNGVLAPVAKADILDRLEPRLDSTMRFSSMRRLPANLLGGLAHGGHEATLRKFSGFSGTEIMTVVACFV